MKRVIVNGQDATLDAATGQWEVSLPPKDNAPLEVSAHSEDVSGNVEQLAHAFAR